MILIIREPITLAQLNQMKMNEKQIVIKLAVDIQREILAGGGDLHSDCELTLLKDGSQQTDVCGADWAFGSKRVTFESVINLRPRQNNFNVVVQDPVLRAKIETIVRHLLEVG